MRARLSLIVLICGFLSGLSAVANADSFADLRAAYAVRDASAAAAAYAPDGIVNYRYDGAPEEIYRGHAAIE